MKLLRLPSFAVQAEGNTANGQWMIGFGDVIGRRLVGGKRTLYSATGRHVIVQMRLNGRESNGRGLNGKVSWNQMESKLTSDDILRDQSQIDPILFAGKPT
jgi:hypothetical protein